MFDCRSAKVTGQLDYARARVIHKDGYLYGFGIDGLLFKTESDKPKRRSGYIRTWDAKSPNGTIEISETCWTCGGWLPVAVKSIDKLINEAQL